MGPNRNPRWEQKRTEGYVIVSRLLALQKRLATPLHYIMECEHFSNFRNRFIATNLRERPNILKLKQIMSAYQKQNLEKICKFIRKINKSFVL